MQGSCPAAIGEGDVAVSRDNDVIEYVDTAELADLAKPRGQLDVLAGRGGIPGWVVVAEDHGGCRLVNERAEYLARVDFDAGKGASADTALADEPVADVESDRPDSSNCAVIGCPLSAIRSSPMVVGGAGPRVRRRDALRRRSSPPWQFELGRCGCAAHDAGGVLASDKVIVRPEKRGAAKAATVTTASERGG